MSETMQLRDEYCKYCKPDGREGCVYVEKRGFFVISQLRKQDLRPVHEFELLSLESILTSEEDCSFDDVDALDRVDKGRCCKVCECFARSAPFESICERLTEKGQAIREKIKPVCYTCVREGKSPDPKCARGTDNV